MIDPYTTEILAACEGLRLVVQRHWQHVILENDALQVVQVICSPSCGFLATGLLLIEDVKISLQNFSTVRVSHIRRSANLTAIVLPIGLNLYCF